MDSAAVEHHAAVADHNPRWQFVGACALLQTHRLTMTSQSPTKANRECPDGGPWSSVLRHCLGDHLPRHIGEPLVPPVVPKREPLVVDAEQVEDGGVDVVDVGFLLGGAQADGVGGADDLAALHAAA